MELFKNLSLTIGSVIILIATVLILAVIGYKLNEINTLKKYISLYNDNWRNELKFTEISNSNYNDFLEILDRNASVSAETNYNYSDEIIAVNLIENNDGSYRNTLERNLNKIEKNPLNEKFIIGEKRDFIEKFKELQSKYYNLEIQSTKKLQATAYFLQNLFPVSMDYAILSDYDEKGTKNVKNFSKNFSDIQTIKKYSEPRYEFEHQGSIKKYLPKAYHVLENYKKYYASYYSIAKDYVSEDYESATYKFSGLQENILNLGVDYKEIFRDAEDNETVKQIIEIIRDQSKLIKDFESSKGNIYSLIGNIGNFEEDLVICQLYDFKAISLFQPLKNKYPEANNSGQLINEISLISPRTDEIDRLFNRTAMEVKNDKNKLTITCKDSNGKRFVYSALKR